MAKDGTLFQTADKLNIPGRGGGGGRRGGGRQDDEEQTSLMDRARDAAKAAGRRKALTAFVSVICLAMTVVAAIFAPKSYEVEGKVLVTRATLIGAAATYVSPEEQKTTAKQFEEQVKSRDNILALIKQAQLVERWDSMRQPHRRIMDQIGAKLGGTPFTDEQKFDALMKTLDAKLRVNVDDATVSIFVEWSDPTAARDIVANAMKNFQDARYGVEIGGINEQLKILESNVARAQGEVAAAATELAIRQREINTTKAPDATVQKYISRSAAAPPPPGADPALVKKLEQIRGEKQAIEDQRAQRVGQLKNQLQELQQQYADGHPSVKAMKDSIRAAESDPPALAALKTQEADVLAQIEAQKNAAPKEAPKPTGGQIAIPVVAVVDAGVPARPKSISDVQAEFDTARNKYDQLTTKLEAARIEAQTAEAGFKRRYSVTRPAELPPGPKRPSGLIAAFLGLALTVLAALATAAIADRFSGIFFEPRHVRDRLGIPVFGTMKW